MLYLRPAALTGVRFSATLIADFAAGLATGFLADATSANFLGAARAGVDWAKGGFDAVFNGILTLLFASNIKALTAG